MCMCVCLQSLREVFHVITHRMANKMWARVRQKIIRIRRRHPVSDAQTSTD